ncbi:hypothetical protein TVAG_017330 [Trichomonas vaginalis G3]|uniref:Uncharacterized protein n=1 Tax=Trichomonas vaginalis (strain ATCC PRA-98 / G3) TaxID=412133 RepID=A2FAT2_TRIV3|nr:hypothetical protein TVAGG3_0889040 [Trichomonas vaginalis G3]EAX97961.1 hypothetical protein TVAG_017330 [Trichomonas vaginalis G3]KAI5502590.1 hypothetical protein TVAGG3_0889040 [Trichomonas vaginalis G3]|eukprot:XP_001310891.1 hypothetical protein [Trichomonas vaginalis G3]
MSVNDFSKDYTQLISLNMSGDSYKGPLVSDPKYKKKFDELKNNYCLTQQFDLIEMLIHNESVSRFDWFQQIQSQSSTFFLFITYDYKVKNKEDYKPIAARIFNIFNNLLQKYPRITQSSPYYEKLSALLQKYFVFGVIYYSTTDPLGYGLSSAISYKASLLKNDLVLKYFDAFMESGSHLLNENVANIEKVYTKLKLLFSEKKKEKKIQHQSQFIEDKKEPPVRTETPTFKEKIPNNEGRETNEMKVNKSNYLETINIINDFCFYADKNSQENDLYASDSKSKIYSKL